MKKLLTRFTRFRSGEPFICHQGSDHAIPGAAKITAAPLRFNFSMLGARDLARAESDRHGHGRSVKSGVWRSIHTQDEREECRMGKRDHVEEGINMVCE